MSIYKSSNLQPHLQEVDIEENNTFTCQVNTSGNPVYAYKLDILTMDGETKIYDGNPTTLDKPVQNKQDLKIPNVSKYSTGMSELNNGKDYQWQVRTYEAPLNSTNQPQTLICSGYLTGSTRYVIWTNNSDQLAIDRWVEFETVGTSRLMPVPVPNSNNMVLPADGETYRERKQISWIEKDLGWQKAITKIELEDEFKYNYKNGTSFKLYKCSDQHTVNSVYVEPNDVIERSYYIVLFDTESHAEAAHDEGYLPSWDNEVPEGKTMPTGIVESARKIMGYGEDTGEIRVQEAFSAPPQNGYWYLLFERLIDVSPSSGEPNWKEITSTVKQVVGGVGIESNDFKVITNAWGEDDIYQLFIQPNINIKTDETNPNEIVFDNDGVRLDIIKKTSDTVVPRKTTDITFDKLDNTQWLLTSFSNADKEKSVVVTPKTMYKVYSDFMDSSPNGVFYARKTPEVIMKFKDESTDNMSDYVVINQEKRIKIQPNSFIQMYNGELAEEYYIEIYNQKGEALKVRGTSETKNLIVDYNLEQGLVYLAEEFEFTRTFSAINTNCYFKLYKDVDGEKEEIKFDGISNTFSEVLLQDEIYTVKVMKNLLINAHDIIKIYKDSLLIGKKVEILSVDHITETNFSIITFSKGDISHPSRVEYLDTYELFDSDGEHKKYFSKLSNYCQEFWGWRDIQFKAEWISTNNTLIKYYQYSLYDDDGVLIGQSDELYDTQLTWSFKGMGSGSDNGAIFPSIPIIFPNQYTIKLRIVDAYDKTFEQEQKFGIYYQVEKGLIPLEIEESCEEHAIRVAPTVPSKVISTNVLDGEGEVLLPSVTSVNVTDGMLKIPVDRCLNYTTIAGSENNIELPSDFSFYTEFKLGDIDNLFLPYVNDGLEITIMKIVHNVVKINQYREEELVPEEIEVRIGSANKFSRFFINGEYVYKPNPNYLKIRVYNLDSDTPDTPLPCFADGADYYSLLENDRMQEFVDIKRALFALQDTSPVDIYQIVDSLPLETGAEAGKYYIPKKSNVDNGNSYYADYIYLYNGSYYILQNEEEYIYIENLRQFENSTYESLQVPTRLQGVNGEIFWTKDDAETTEELNKWIDSGYITLNNRRALSRKWFKFYLTAKTENNQEEIHCDIEITNERS